MSRPLIGSIPIERHMGTEGAQSGRESTQTTKETLSVGDIVLLNDFMDESASWDNHVEFRCKIIWSPQDQGDAVGEVIKRHNNNAPKKGAEVMVLDEWVFDSKKCRLVQ